MIRDTANIVLTGLVVAVMVGLLVFYGRTNLDVDSNQVGMTEMIRTTVINNRDDSARVQRGTFILDKDNFETDFKELFARGRNLSSSDDVDYDFEYLKDGSKEDAVKAVRVTVLVNGTEFKATSIVDVKS